MNHIALDNQNVDVYLFDYKKGFLKVNGNDDSGVKMALEDRNKALQELTSQLESNDQNLAKAKSSAEMFIKNFIKNVNPQLELKDSDIVVEFC